jgi:AcrR family transcriptional regulator
VPRGPADPTSARRPGRPRDDAIDGAVLAATLEQLASNGYEAMSVVAIASSAGTTRQAIYRRWPTKADLAVAAIARLPEAADIEPTGDHRADLLAELTAFHRGVLRPGGVSMVGSMLQEAVDPELRERYRARVVRPRRRRLRAILDAAQRDGLLVPEIDTSMLAASCTGTLYALVLAGDAVPPDWPDRMVTNLLGSDPR